MLKKLIPEEYRKLYRLFSRNERGKIAVLFFMMLVAVIMVWQGRPLLAIIPVLTLYGIATVRLMPAIQTMTSTLTTLGYGLASFNLVHDDLELINGYSKVFLDDRKHGERKPFWNELELRDVDGQHISAGLSAWQKNIGYIPQFIYLCDNSLRRNIAFGVPEAEIDDAKVMKAIKLAQLSELVQTLPDGLDTTIGEGGTRLSGGHRPGTLP